VESFEGEDDDSVFCVNVLILLL